MEKSPLRIRLAHAGDIAIIVAANLHLALETEELALDPTTLAAGVARALQEGSGALYYVAEVEGKGVVGQLMITKEWSDCELCTLLLINARTPFFSGRCAFIHWIQSVFVEPSHRRQVDSERQPPTDHETIFFYQGVFTALYMHAREEAVRGGAAGLRLYADVKNERAHSVVGSPTVCFLSSDDSFLLLSMKSLVCRHTTRFALDCLSA